MNRLPSREEIDLMKSRYPVGTRVEMVHCADLYSTVPAGVQGTVNFVDDMLTLHVNWDNGSSLGIIIGEDRFSVVS